MPLSGVFKLLPYRLFHIPESAEPVAERRPQSFAAVGFLRSRRDFPSARVFCIMESRRRKIRPEVLCFGNHFIAKERMLLEDQKSHEQICIEKYDQYASRAQDGQLKQIFQANGQQERTHLDTLNQLLAGKIPDMNQQQNQGTAQPANSVQPAAGSLSDQDMCLDTLMTEKYVSGTYDTAILNSGIRRSAIS